MSGERLVEAAPRDKLVASARSVERDLGRIQKRVAGRVLRALREARRDVIDALAEQPKAWRVHQLQQVLRETERAMRIFERASQSAAAAGALEHADASIRLALGVLAEPGVTLSAEVAISATDIVIAYDALPVLITQVSDEAIAKIGNVLRRVVMAGLTPHDAMKLIGKISGKGPFASAFHRAETIVRTELHRIGGTAMQRQLHEINQRRPGLYKKWLAVLDDRTRDAHREADGQVVPVDEFFHVGGHPMRFPGDPLGGGNNVINCRCMMIGWRDTWG